MEKVLVLLRRLRMEKRKRKKIFSVSRKAILIVLGVTAVVIIIWGFFHFRFEKGGQESPPGGGSSSQELRGALREVPATEVPVLEAVQAPTDFTIFPVAYIAYMADRVSSELRPKVSAADYLETLTACENRCEVGWRSLSEVERERLPVLLETKGIGSYSFFSFLASNPISPGSSLEEKVEEFIRFRDQQGGVISSGNVEELN